MTCTEIENRLIDYINQELDAKTSDAITHHLDTCFSCQKDLEELKKIYHDIEQVPIVIPDNSLRENFESMLQQEISLEKKKDIKSFNWKTVFQIAATIVLMLSSFFYGKLQSQKEHDYELASINAEKQEYKQQMTISLMDHNSASKRLLAVNYVEDIEHPNTAILEALITKMHYDNHINVRLAAAEALSRFSKNEKVRKALIHALERESEPDMQIELIQILVNIQEKRAVPSLERLLHDQKTLDYVKDQAKIGLPKLI